MAENLVIYTILHQPRRLKLPAEPIRPGADPAEIERCLFDEAMNEFYFRKVARWCYYPATEMFLEFADQGFSFSIGFSLSALRQARLWDPGLYSQLRKLAAHPSVELVNVEPYHSFLPLIDLPAFAERMSWSRDNLQELMGRRPEITDTTEMLMSGPIYQALNGAGFKGALMDGRPWVMEWREPTHLYHQGKDLMLLPRHFELSDDVGYRFSNKGWWGYPLMADAYSHWVRDAWGDFVLLAWDFETFGEHHSKDTGIFEFMRRLPEELGRRGVKTLRPSDAVARFRGSSYELPLPAFPSTWAGEGGMEFFLGNPAQQAVFQLMLQAYNQAQLTKDPRLIDLALWLTQSDNLHLIQWFGRSGSEAEVSAYFTPREWWNMGPSGIIWEMQQVYKNFIRALGPYL